MAKREVDRLVYKTVLSFLNESIELYTEYVLATEKDGDGGATRYKEVLNSCMDIKNTFLETYTPRKSRRGEGKPSPTGKELNIDE